MRIRSGSSQQRERVVAVRDVPDDVVAPAFQDVPDGLNGYKLVFNNENFRALHSSLPLRKSGI